jgi:hypothetical protein
MQLLSLPGTFAHLTPEVLLSTVLNSSHSSFFTHNGEPSFTFTLCTLNITIEVLRSLMISVVPSTWNIICFHFWGCFLLPFWIFRKIDREFKLLNLNLFSVWHQQILCRRFITLHKRNWEVCVTNLPRSYEFLVKNKIGQILDKPQSVSLGGFQIRCFQVTFCVGWEKLTCRQLVGERVGSRPFESLVHNEWII